MNQRRGDHCLTPCFVFPNLPSWVCSRKYSVRRVQALLIFAVGVGPPCVYLCGLPVSVEMDGIINT